MTALSRAQLQSVFQTNDIPTGTDYSNLIDSCLNLVDSSTQQINGPINPTELIASRVSAGNVNITGTLTVAGIFSASSIVMEDITASAGHFTTIGTTNLTAAATVSASAVNTNTLVSPVISIKCSGSTLATANELGFNVTSMITAVTDGADTGVRLKANSAGLVQYLINDTATSANLWPPTGGQINALASGAAFPLAGHTQYTIIHIRASGYTVK